MSKRRQKHQDRQIGINTMPQAQGTLFPQPTSGQHLARTHSVYPIDYADRSLFGMDDAAHEDLSLLKSYSLDRRDCEEFFDESIPFLILKAPKGSGKTTLCRIFEDELSRRPAYVSLLRYDAQISPSLESAASLSDWIRAWKANIADQILVSLSNNAGFAVDADIITAIERAEKRGQKRQNFVGLLREHFSLKFVKESPSTSKDIKYDDVLRRVAERKDSKIWIFLDEVDQYFTNDAKSIMKVASMLLAARDMSSYIDNLTVRVTIKPNVWAILREEIDSLANINEFQLELSWDDTDVMKLLARRVESYLERSKIQRFDERLLYGESTWEKDEWLISQVFLTENFDLGKGNRPPHTIMALLGFYRPRWILDLCKTTIKRVVKEGGMSKDLRWSLISCDRVLASLDEFGRERIRDISSEYKSQCKQISKIINGFHGSRSAFEGMAQLADFIENRITSKFDVSIVGVSEKATPQEVACYLHQIGFIDARKEISLSEIEHVPFHQHPSLANTQQLDENDDFGWEIHPAFRRALYISHQSNRSIQDTRKEVAARKRALEEQKRIASSRKKSEGFKEQLDYVKRALRDNKS